MFYASSFMILNVLYEDNHLIAVEKPAGMLVQGDKTGDTCLMDEVKKYLKEKYKKPGNVFLGLIHRLDRPVGGIVLFAKTTKGASRLSEQFREREVGKRYHAIVSPAPRRKKDTIVSWLLKDERRNETQVFDQPTYGADRAELSYEVLEEHEGRALVAVDLKTGRSHQIRAQLASIGAPIEGDVKYRSRVSRPDRTIALFSTELAFETATGGERKTISLPPPTL
jgi:23S rRNA pseudouridine1911/1915/1917 synthase